MRKGIGELFLNIIEVFSAVMVFWLFCWTISRGADWVLSHWLVIGLIVMGLVGFIAWVSSAELGVAIIATICAGIIWAIVCGFAYLSTWFHYPERWLWLGFTTRNGALVTTLIGVVLYFLAGVDDKPNKTSEAKVDEAGTR